MITNTTNIVNAISVYRNQGSAYVNYTIFPTGIGDLVDYSSSVSNSSSLSKGSTIYPKHQLFIQRTQYRRTQQRALRKSVVKQRMSRIFRAITWRR